MSISRRAKAAVTAAVLVPALAVTPVAVADDENGDNTNTTQANGSLNGSVAGSLGSLIPGVDADTDLGALLDLLPALQNAGLSPEDALALLEGVSRLDMDIDQILGLIDLLTPDDGDDDGDDESAEE